MPPPKGSVLTERLGMPEASPPLTQAMPYPPKT
jgi:hypothetical protein